VRVPQREGGGLSLIHADELSDDLRAHVRTYSECSLSSNGEVWLCRWGAFKRQSELRDRWLGAVRPGGGGREPD